MYSVFFCKHKTAYEMRIRDWSSDVCSSDLAAAAVDRRGLHHADALAAAPFAEPRLARQEAHDVIEQAQHDEQAAEGQGDVGITEAVHEIGRASLRERVCEYE